MKKTVKVQGEADNSIETGYIIYLEHDGTDLDIGDIISLSEDVEEDSLKFAQFEVMDKTKSFYKCKMVSDNKIDDATTLTKML